MKKTSVFVLLLFVLMTIAAFASEDDGDDKECRVGESANVGGLSVRVESVTPYKEKNSVMAERLKGQCKGVPMNYYAVEIVILNGSRNSFEFSPYQFSLADTNGDEHQWCISTREPKLEGKVLNPGMAAKGFLVFGIPQTSAPEKVVFDPAYLYDGMVYFYTGSIGQ